MSLVDIIQYAKKVNNFIEDATDNDATNEKFDSDQLQEYEVPPGKRWILIGGVVYRDVSSTVVVDARDASDNIIAILSSESAAAGVSAYPNPRSTAAVLQAARPLILDAGEYVNIAFGTAQTGGAYASCIVLEIEV